jgi:hypothetical protein
VNLWVFSEPQGHHDAEGAVTSGKMHSIKSLIDRMHFELLDDPRHSGKV